MTKEERRHYNSLTEEQKEDFNILTDVDKKEYWYQHSKHPNWTYKQLMIKLGFEKKTDETINTRKDPDPNDPEIWKIIIDGVKDFLNNFPTLKEVVRIINNSIRKITEWGKDLIDSIIDWIF